jgi:two-component system, cell cycle sensor histidine kinase and response regulator CckA
VTTPHDTPIGTLHLRPLVPAGGAEPRDFVVVAADAEGARLAGRPPDALIGQSAYALYPADRVDALLGFLRAAWAGQGGTVDVPAVSGSFSATWTRLRAERVGDLVHLHAQDITAPRIQEAREAADAAYRALLVERAVDGVVLLGPDARIVEANQAFADLLTVDVAALPGRRMPTLVADDVTRRVRRELVADDGTPRIVELATAVLPHGYRQVVVTDRTAIETSERNLRESEARFREAMTAAGVAAWEMDQRAETMSASEAHRELFGLGPDDPLPATLAEMRAMVHPDDRDALFQRRRSLSDVTGNGPVPFDTDFRIVTLQGEVRWIRTRGALVRDAENPVGRIRAVAWDVTREIEARRELAISEERFRSAFDDAGLGMALVSRDGRNLRVNAALSQILGYTEAELLHITWKDVVHPDDLDASLLNWERFDRREVTSVTSEKRYFHKDGHQLWVKVTISMVRDDQGRPLHFLAQVEDISARRRLEEALAESEVRFRNAFEASAIGLAILSPAGETVQINAALAEMLGYTVDEALRLNWRDVIHPDDREAGGANLARVARGELPSARALRRYLHRDGHVLWTQVTISAVRQAGGTAALFVQIEDVSERERLAAEQAATKERLALVIDALEDGVWDFDITSGGGTISPRWSTMLGLPACERIGHAEFLALLHPDDRARIKAAMAEQLDDPTAPPYDVEFRMARADGTWAQIRSRGRVVARDDAGRPLRMVGTHTDVTERRLLEDQFRHAQKMEAVGKLAGGIAHDFNNLLTTISATTQVLREEGTLGAASRADLDQILLATERAAALTSQLLAFSRLEVDRRDQVTLDDAVRQVEPLLRRLMAPGQDLVMQLQAGRACVQLDPAQLELALLNLVANARDAMPGGGTVTLTTRLADRDWVEVVVQDTGVGMAPDVASRIFEPFFTTKPQGKGTGLGLATV